MSPCEKLNFLAHKIKGSHGFAIKVDPSLSLTPATWSTSPRPASLTKHLKGTGCCPLQARVLGLSEHARAAGAAQRASGVSLLAAGCSPAAPLRRDLNGLRPVPHQVRELVDVERDVRETSQAKAEAQGSEEELGAVGPTLGGHPCSPGEPVLPRRRSWSVPGQT